MRLFILFIAVILSGCSNLPQQIGKVNDAMNNLASYGSGNDYSSFDERNYNAISNADSTVSVRASRLGKPDTPLVRGLLEACNRGLDVSVILYVGGQRTASSVANSCVKVYVTDNPDLRSGPATILTDGIFVTVNGAWVASNDRNSRREYYLQQQQKLLSTRLQ